MPRESREESITSAQADGAREARGGCEVAHARRSLAGALCRRETMTRRFAIYLLSATAILAGVIQCACLLTKGVVDRASGRTPWYADITQIKQSGTVGDTLFLQLELRSRERPASGTVLLRVPFEDIGTYRHGEPAGPLERDSLRLQAPALGYLEAGTALPDDARPIEVEYVDVRSQQALEDRVYTLPFGIHVLIVLDIYSSAGRTATPLVQRDGVVPERAHVLLVRRIPDGAPRQFPLRAFNEARHKNRAWLLLTPLTIVGDIVTSPIQLLILLGD